MQELMVLRNTLGLATSIHIQSVCFMMSKGAFSPGFTAAEALTAAAKYECKQHQKANHSYHDNGPSLKAVYTIAAVQRLEIAGQCSDC